MKQPQLTHLLLSATLFLSAGALRAEEGAAPAPAPAPEPGPRHAEMIKKFDKNGDGKLDESERAAAREAVRAWRQEHRPELAGPGGPDRERGPAARGWRDPGFRRAYLLGKFDANSDGKLDDTEKAALRAFVDDRARQKVEKELQRLRAVDTDNDGKLSAAEWAVAKEKFKQEHPKRAEMAEEGLPPPPPPHGGGPGGPGAPVSDDDQEDAP